MKESITQLTPKLSLLWGSEESLSPSGETMLLFWGQTAPFACFQLSEPGYHKKTGFYFTVTQENEELADDGETLFLCYVKCLQTA